MRENASWKMLRYFIPITIISTPLGQITGDRISTDLVEAIGGCLVTFVAVFEMYQKRANFLKLIRKYGGCRQQDQTDSADLEEEHDVENQKQLVKSASSGTSKQDQSSLDQTGRTGSDMSGSGESAESIDLTDSDEASNASGMFADAYEQMAFPKSWVKAPSRWSKKAWTDKVTRRLPSKLCAKPTFLKRKKAG